MSEGIGYLWDYIKSPLGSYLPLLHTHVKIDVLVIGFRRSGDQ